MAQQNLATLHSTVKIDFGKTLKQLKQLKKSLSDIKESTDKLNNIKALAKTNASHSKQNALLERKKKITQKLLMMQAKLDSSGLSNKSQAAFRKRIQTMQELNKSTKNQAAIQKKMAEYDRRMVVVKHQEASARKKVAIAATAERNAAREAARQKKMAIKALSGWNQKMAKGTMALKRQEAALNRHSAAASKNTSILKRLRSAVVGLTASYTAFAGGAFVNQLGQDIQAAEIMFGTIFEERAPEAMNFMREQANRLGLELVANSKAFAKYAVAAGAAGFGLDEVKEQFLGVAEAGVVFGLSMEQQLGMIRAMEQIASKGTVQMEELKLQMGDRMPAALSIAAKAMGMTRKELIKTIEQGKLASKDFIPKFTAELRNMASGGLEAALKTPRVAQGQMVMAFQELTEVFFKGGFGEFLKTTFEILRDVFKILKPIGILVGAVFSVVAGILEPFKILIGLLADLMDQVDWSSLAEGVSKAAKMIGNLLSFILSPFRALMKLLSSFLKMLGIVGKTAQGVAATTSSGQKVMGGIHELAENSRVWAGGAKVYTKTSNFVANSAQKDILRTDLASRIFGGVNAVTLASTPSTTRTYVETQIGFDRRAERVLKEKNTRQTTNNSRE